VRSMLRRHPQDAPDSANVINRGAARLRFSLRIDPVFQTKARDLRKLSRIVRNQDRVE
jgi:hypothetical protein